MTRFLGRLAVLLMLLATPVFANPVPYYSGPNDVPNVMVNTAIQNVNNAFPSTQYTVVCTGTTTATCQGLRLHISTTRLHTAAGATAAATTVTDASVTAASQMFCQVNSYAGTGNPLATNIVPAAGSFTFQIQNTHASAALNATVVTTCLIYN